ncbi:MAG TPA: TlpA family protein disulfide reductase [Desulfobulbus sp.]|nr:TlpA family protein disulfide reductase [Desulfobulbus sp.]
MLHRALLPAFWFLLTICLLSGCSRQETPPLKVGDPAPAFTATDMEGRTISSTQLAGHPAILRFFLIDCKFCKADTPVLNDLYRQYNDSGLAVVYIETLGVPDDDIRRFVHDLDIRFPVVRDKGAGIASRYNVKSLPLTVVIDPQGKIIGAILGGISKAELTSLLAPWLPAAQKR